MTAQTAADKSERDTKILRLAAQGIALDTIAERLGMAASTVRRIVSTARKVGQ